MLQLPDAARLEQCEGGPPDEFAATKPVFLGRLVQVRHKSVIELNDHLFSSHDPTI